MPAGSSYLFKEGMLSPIITRTYFDGRTFYQIVVKNHFLHAIHPVGWIKRMTLKIDGRDIPGENVYFVLRGQWFSLSSMRTISEVFWNITEPAFICFQTAKPITAGKHELRCTFVTSMLEDTQILDVNGQWPERTEYVESIVELEALNG